ncbi:Splicing factor 45 [Cichlidogyrus casuarinus]|uniref:Splicing factor 45 n=1 Tax=Cichlidogyrus casuarinus TaxID=1844966 RepID=A0ABD2QF82_9PLAT
MCGPGEVDQELEPETAEECSKYGPVRSCMIYEMPDAVDEETVRIFIEFADTDAALEASYNYSVE